MGEVHGERSAVDSDAVAVQLASGRGMGNELLDNAVIRDRRLSGTHRRQFRDSEFRRKNLDSRTGGAVIDRHKEPGCGDDSSGVSENNRDSASAQRPDTSLGRNV